MIDYQSKYNEIVTDNRANSPISNKIVTLTLEQYYDLLHHTHKISDMSGGTTGGGSAADPELVSKIEELTKKVNELTAAQAKNTESISQINTKLEKVNTDTPLNVVIDDAEK